MMATTHALVGLLVGVVLASLVPGPATPVVVAGAVGGVAPDFDVLATHRKTLHAPVVGGLLAGVLLSVAVLTGTPWAAAATAFAAAAALHAVTDAFDGGRSVRPWAESVDRGVFCHAQGRWWRPRRLVAYDGSPADLAVAGVLALATTSVAEQPSIRALGVGLVLVSIPYVLVRKRLPDWAPLLVARIDAAMDSRQPDSARTDRRS